MVQAGKLAVYRYVKCSGRVLDMSDGRHWLHILVDDMIKEYILQ